jgi:peptidoglycan/LPS O-acetylase OafA/YrhL
LRLFLFQTIKLRSNSINFAGEVVNLTTISHFDAFASGAFVIFLLEKYKNLNIQKIKILIFISSLCFILIGFVNILSNTKNNVPGLHDILTFGFPHLMIKNFGYFWGYSLINTFCAIILFSVLKFPDLFYILKNKFLVFTGKISYGLYLFHIPVLLLTQWLNSNKIYNNVISLIIYLSLTYLISFLSYKYIETFFLKFKNKII